MASCIEILNAPPVSGHSQLEPADLPFEEQDDRQNSLQREA
jgi:hypothetical protein